MSNIQFKAVDFFLFSSFSFFHFIISFAFIKSLKCENTENSDDKKISLLYYTSKSTKERENYFLPTLRFKNDKENLLLYCSRFVLFRWIFFFCAVIGARWRKIKLLKFSTSECEKNSSRLVHSTVAIAQQRFGWRKRKISGLQELMAHRKAAVKHKSLVYFLLKCIRAIPFPIFIYIFIYYININKCINIQREIS